MIGRIDPRAALERALAPDVVQAIDALVGERVGDAVERLRAEQQAFGGRAWVTTAEAAQALGCSEAAVRARHKRGRLQGAYTGRRLYISTASILDPSGLGADTLRTTNKVAPATLTRPGARTRRS